jgi:fatty acid desaturase
MITKILDIAVLLLFLYLFYRIVKCIIHSIIKVIKFIIRVKRERKFTKLFILTAIVLGLLAIAIYSVKMLIPTIVDIAPYFFGGMVGLLILYGLATGKDTTDASNLDERKAHAGAWYGCEDMYDYF